MNCHLIPQVTDIKTQPHVELCWYIPSIRSQFRIHGYARVYSGDLTGLEEGIDWESISMYTLILFTITLCHAVSCYTLTLLLSMSCFTQSNHVGSDLYTHCPPDIKATFSSLPPGLPLGTGELGTGYPCFALLIVRAEQVDFCNYSGNGGNKRLTYLESEGWVEREVNL